MRARQRDRGGHSDALHEDLVEVPDDRQRGGGRGEAQRVAEGEPHHLRAGGQDPELRAMISAGQLIPASELGGPSGLGVRVRPQCTRVFRKHAEHHPNPVKTPQNASRTS